jgi:hypothetical protein
MQNVEPAIGRRKGLQNVAAGPPLVSLEDDRRLARANEFSWD